MRFNEMEIGFAITGAHYSLPQILRVVQDLVEEGANITSIISNSLKNLGTCSDKAKGWKSCLMDITKNKIIDTLFNEKDAPVISDFDCLIIAPCTGNTLAKLVKGITDTPVLFAAISHLNNSKPLILAISTNDALGLNASNIATLLNTKNIYFVPFGQDRPKIKSNSLVAHMDKIPDTIEAGCRGQQVQPILVEYLL